MLRNNNIIRGMLTFDHRRFILWVLRLSLLFFVILQPAALSAEFLQTGPGVFQNRTLREKVVVSYSVPGIFVSSGSVIDIQLFDPSLLEVGNAQHVFIQYDPQTDRYVSLFLGRREHRIRGSLTVSLDRLRIAIDNNNPYLSVVVDEDSSILGFQGTKQIVMADGEAAVALLEANQFNQFTDTVAPYSYRDGRLFLKGRPVTRKSVGLRLRPPDNICLNEKKVIYISYEDIARIRKARSSSGRALLLEETLRRNKNYNPFKESLHLRIDKSSLISLNYLDGSVMQTKSMHSKFSKKTVCLVRELEF